jgi:hypothetical protein
MARKPKSAEAELPLEPPAVEAPPAGERDVVVEAPQAPQQDDLAASIETLKAQLERERNHRIAAETRANEAASREVYARNEVDTTNLQLINNAIHMVKGNTEALKAEYAQAMENGEFSRAADIQQGMADNAAKMLQLEEGKAAAEQQPKRAPPAPQSQGSGDPVEDFARRLSPRSGDWVRRHPQYATDQRLFNKMVAAHNLVTADGIAADTDEYFREVESILRVQPAEDEGDASSYQQSQVTQRRASPAAAPVSRSSPGDRNVMRLSAEEREMAQMMKMTDEEYAKNKLELKRAGKLN